MPGVLPAVVHGILPTAVHGFLQASLVQGTGLSGEFSLGGLFSFADGHEVLVFLDIDIGRTDQLLAGDEFRAKLEELGGYSLENTGKVIKIRG